MIGAYGGQLMLGRWGTLDDLRQGALAFYSVRSTE